MKNNFDGLRLVGALLVLVSHEFLLMGRPEPKIEGLSLGLAGVAMFFGTSGYLVSASWDRDPNLIRFAARRLLRIWPALALLIGVLCAYCWLYPWNSNLARWQYPQAAELFIRWLFFHDWDWNFFPANPAVGLDRSLWTIPYEVSFYAFLGVGALLLKRYMKWMAVAALLGSVLLVSHGAFLLACFAAGAVMWHFKKWGPWLVVLAVGVTSLPGFYGRAATILIAGATVLLGVRSWLLLREGARFGDLSYGVYLWGWPVGQVAVLFLGTGPYTTLLLATTLYSAAIALLSWHLVEKQALKLKPRPGSNWGTFQPGSGAGARWWRNARSREEAAVLVVPSQDADQPSATSRSISPRPFA